MLALTFLIAAFELSLRVSAVNDWNVPCTDGKCSYDWVGDANTKAFSSLAVVCSISVFPPHIIDDSLIRTALVNSFLVCIPYPHFICILIHSPPRYHPSSRLESLEVQPRLGRWQSHPSHGLRRNSGPSRSLQPCL